jgi:hypothetical protein
MGADFSNRWFFASEAVAAEARAAVVGCFCDALQNAGFHEVMYEEEADRSLVVGPPGRWVFIGDSAGSTEKAAEEDFDALSHTLSTLGPVVAVKMSDGVAVHFYLYRHGRLIDKFGNAKFPFFSFATEQEAVPYQGHPELWSDLLLSPDAVHALRSIWVQEWKANEILAETGRLLGWDPELSEVGYTYDDEGLPIKYDEFLRDSDVELGAFSEFHFKRLQSR